MPPIRPTRRLTRALLIAGRPLREPMPVAITAQMDDTELSALWMYLSSMR